MMMTMISIFQTNFSRRNAHRTHCSHDLLCLKSCSFFFFLFCWVLLTYLFSLCNFTRPYVWNEFKISKHQMFDCSQPFATSLLLSVWSVHWANVVHSYILSDFHYCVNKMNHLFYLARQHPSCDTYEMNRIWNAYGIRKIKENEMRDNKRSKVNLMK